MSPPIRALIAAGIDLVVVLADIALTVINAGEVGFAISTAVAVVPYLTTGFLIAWRRPSNPIGWLVLALPLSFALSAAVGEYSVMARATGAPGAALAAWLSFWIWVPGWLALGMVFLLFPDGRLPRPYGRPIASVIIAASGVATVLAAVNNDPRGTQTGQANPLALDVPISLYDVLIPFILIVFAAPTIALVARYRAGTERVRKQLKWFAYGGSLLVVVSLMYLVVLRSAGGGRTIAADELFLVAIAAPAVAIGIAILRDRVFDIDVLIRRTLVYGATIGTMGAAFVAAALILQAILRPITGGSDVAIAGSTLLTVAAFQPLRRRLQAGIDRRFYRSRYDAVRTLDAFTARMRDEVDIDAVRGEVLDVVSTTVRPAHASVWLRGGRR